MREGSLSEGSAGSCVQVSAGVGVGGLQVEEPIRRRSQHTPGYKPLPQLSLLRDLCPPGPEASRAVVPGPGAPDGFV